MKISLVKLSQVNKKVPMSSNVHWFLYSLLLAMTLSFLSVDSVYSQINIVQRSSFTTVGDIDEDGSSFSDSSEFNGPGTYNESHNLGNIQASQTSSIIDGVFDIQTFSQGANSAVDCGFTEANTFFDAEFEVLSASNFTLAGILVNDDLSADNNFLSVSLIGGDIDLTFDSSTFSSVPFDTAGILLPGTYELSVSSFSLGSSSTSTPVGPVSSNTVLTVTPVSVPEPSALPAIFLVIASTFRRRRSTSVSYRSSFG